MKRTTITLPDGLQDALERYQNDQPVPPPASALIQAALREYLARRGYGQQRAAHGLRITPAGKGSGSADVSVEHDRYFADAAKR